jgi:hypothetical protein
MEGGVFQSTLKRQIEMNKLLAALIAAAFATTAFAADPAKKADAKPAAAAASAAKKADAKPAAAAPAAKKEEAKPAAAAPAKKEEAKK